MHTRFLSAWLFLGVAALGARPASAALRALDLNLELATPLDAPADQADLATDAFGATLASFYIRSAAAHAEVQLRDALYRPLGPPARVGEPGDGTSARWPNIVPLEEGFLLAWQDDTPPVGELASSRLRLARIEGDGDVDVELLDTQLAPSPTSTLRWDRLLLRCRGAICLAAWLEQRAHEQRILGQGVDVDGTFLGEPTELYRLANVGPYDPGINQLRLSVAADGRFVIGWTEFRFANAGPSRYFSRAYARTFGANGVALTAPLVLQGDVFESRPLQEPPPPPIEVSWQDGGTWLAIHRNGNPPPVGGFLEAQQFNALGQPLRTTLPGPCDRPVLRWFASAQRHVLLCRTLDPAAEGPPGFTWRLEASLLDPLAARLEGPVVLTAGRPLTGAITLAGPHPSALHAGFGVGQRFLGQSFGTSNGLRCAPSPPDPVIESCFAFGPEDRLRTYVEHATPAGFLPSRPSGTSVAAFQEITPDTLAASFTSPLVPEALIKTVDGRSLNEALWIFVGSMSDLEFRIHVEDVETGAVRSYYNPPGRLASLADVDAFPDPGSASSAPQGPTLARAEPALPVLGGAFTIEVVWRDFQGNSGTGLATPFSDYGGFFTFFSPDNVELAVKLLDGRAVNGHYWLFYASLTNVEFTLTVRDGAGNVVRAYQNLSGALRSLADVRSFP